MDVAQHMICWSGLPWSESGMARLALSSWARVRHGPYFNAKQHMFFRLQQAGHRVCLGVCGKHHTTLTLLCIQAWTHKREAWWKMDRKWMRYGWIICPLANPYCVCVVWEPLFLKRNSPCLAAHSNSWERLANQINATNLFLRTCCEP